MKAQSNFYSLLVTFLMLCFFQVEFTAQTTVIKGKLLDVEEKPSKFALVGVSVEAGRNGIQFINCDEDGSYTITLTKPGMNFLIYSAPSHNPLRIPICNNKNKEVKIDVTLAPYEYKDNFDEVSVAGTFNNFDYKSPEKMIKKENGTFYLEIKSDQKEIEFQLCGITKNGRTVNSPESSSFEPDKSGDYKSIVVVKEGKAEIIFDPSKLINKNAANKVAFSDSDFDEKLYKYCEAYLEVSSDVNQKLRVYVDANKNIKGFQYDGEKYFIELLKNIDEESDSLLNDYLKLAYISFSSYNLQNHSAEKASSFLESVSLESLAWELLPQAFYTYRVLIPQYKWTEFEDTFLSRTASNSIKVGILSAKLIQAKSRNNVEQLRKLHELISSEYKEIKEAQELLKRFPIETKIKIGTEIPNYEVASIDKPQEIFSKQSMKGKIYLIDFWATWCGPCVGEMKTLHSVYEKFKDKGLEILSLSLDGKADDVIKFRNEKWKMPWMNAFIGNAEGRKIAENFEVVGIPRPLLISAEGTILETEGTLRGENLEKTLLKYFK